MRRLLASAMIVAAFAPISAAAEAACDRQLVMRIDSAMVSHTPEGIQINAYGVASSAGWTLPKLVVDWDQVGETAHVDFTACRPGLSAQVLTPIQTQDILRLKPATRRIVLRAASNSMTVEISQR